MPSANRFRRFDLGNKAIEGIFDSSIVGAIVTIASVSLMLVLFLSELLMYVKVDTTSHMAVADFHEHDAVTARLHATFPYIECKDLEIQADHPRGGVGNLDAIMVDRRPASKKDRKTFKPTGSGSGCTLDGTIDVERAAGSIVVRVMNHDPARLVSLRGFLTPMKGEMRHGPSGVAGPNVTHSIHDFGFGPSVAGPVGVDRNSLAGSNFVAQQGAGIVKYALKVVPIAHQQMNGAEVNTHTYSANVAFSPESATMQSLSPSTMLLGIELTYDFTPIMVRYTDTRKSMFEFITSVCAIVGGIYTVSGLLVRGVQGIPSIKQD